MPKCEYYSSKDIQEILGIGKRKANEILHMFEQRGQLFRDGKTLRVRISYFEEWRDRIDGDTKRTQIVERRLSSTSQKRARTA